MEVLIELCRLLIQVKGYLCRKYKMMTYREIFLQGDPHVVYEAIGTHEVEFRGRKLRLTVEQAFDICKGFKFYAKGMRLDVPEEEEIQKILNDDEHKPQFRWTRKQAQIFVAAKRGWLRAACEALGCNQTSNPDELVNEWLNQAMPDCSGDANKLATYIITKLIISNLLRYERFKS